MTPNERLERARARFRERFGGEPTHRVRAPGRVNLIGEHIDYCGLGVLPMAIDRSVDLLLRPRSDSTLSIENVDPDYAPVRFEASPDVEPGTAGSWENYLKAAVHEFSATHGRLNGFDGVVCADLPSAAGLSSSSALVTAVGVAVHRINALPEDPHRLAEAMARAERFVGVRGGGMDQAASLLGRRGHALRIDFNPLRTSTVPIPNGWAMIVAHSLSRAEKSGKARAAYNRRTEECRTALELISRTVAAELGGTPPETYPELRAVRSTDALIALGNSLLDPPVRLRFRHVITEAERVDRAQEALRNGNLDAFGEAMTASHESLRTDYAVSSPALDELVERAMAGGAAGARLTGAGFGGCALALCDERRRTEVIEALEPFYAERVDRDPVQWDQVLFPVQAADGASFTELSDST